MGSEVVVTPGDVMAKATRMLNASWLCRWCGSCVFLPVAS